MNIDLQLDIDKLSPAPWHVDDFNSSWHSITSGSVNDETECQIIDDPMELPDMVMCAMARNFLEITMRRGLGVIVHPDGWGVDVILPKLRLMRWDDPFTAVIEAEKWWVENMGEKV